MKFWPVVRDDALGTDIGSFLCDKNYEKRKQGARDLERKVREALKMNNDTETIRRIITTLRHSYVESQMVSEKKGGLIGLASVAIGLDAEIKDFLEALVTPVFKLLKDCEERDYEARVRYYACEALFNIAKVAGDSILKYFEQIFQTLCKLCADMDADVKKGAQVLDRLMKDIVDQGMQSRAESELRLAESEDQRSACSSLSPQSSLGQQVESSQTLRPDFVKPLADHLQHRSPFLRQMLLGWIRLLLKEPGAEMAEKLPEYLESLFKMLEDQARDIRQNADGCLNEVLTNVAESPKALEIIAQTTVIVVKSCRSEDPGTRLIALCWLRRYVQIQRAARAKRAPDAPFSDDWMKMLPDILQGTLHCIDAGDQEQEIDRLALEIHRDLLEMSRTLQPGSMPVGELVEKLQHTVKRRGSPVAVRTACLQWFRNLLELSSEMFKMKTLDQLLEHAQIFESLLDAEDEVVAVALDVLAKIMEGKPEAEPLDDNGRDLFTIVTQKLLDLFKKERQMLDMKGRLMIRHLCGHLNARRLYVTVARAIQLETSDVQSSEFAEQLAQTFSWILLTANETKSLREELLETKPPVIVRGQGWQGLPRPQEGEPQQQLFLELCELFHERHTPVSALALCLCSQQYELAVELTARFATLEPTLDLVPVLSQLDQLVHLVESPVFSSLRLRLLEPQRHPALLKSLLGLAMLLPRTEAFNVLRERIYVLQSGLLLEAQRCKVRRRRPKKAEADPAARTTESLPQGRVELASLLTEFDDVLARVG